MTLSLGKWAGKKFCLPKYSIPEKKTLTTPTLTPPQFVSKNFVTFTLMIFLLSLEAPQSTNVMFNQIFETFVRKTNQAFRAKRSLSLFSIITLCGSIFINSNK